MMVARALGGRQAAVQGGSILLAALLLGGCATQHQTAQALTIAGAAAVIVGASMAADSACYDPGEGAVDPYCSQRLSKGARNVGKGVAVAGVGLAAAGYALTPKGPDRTQRLRSDPPGAGQRSPYRLIRPEPPPEAAGAKPEPTAACRPEGSAAEEPSDPCPPEQGLPEARPR